MDLYPAASLTNLRARTQFWYAFAALRSFVDSFPFACFISLLDHHNKEDGHRRASHESTPHFRPAPPSARPRQASTETSSSHIQDVPNSEIQRLPRNRKAMNAAGRVNRPMTSRTPREISVKACSGAAIAALLTTRLITAFHT